MTHTLKSQNLFPTVGATGPCSVHVNFGQMGFVFIEANVKKWGLAPMTGSLAPPPPYGSEAGSILLEGGKHGVSEGQGLVSTPTGGMRPHSRSLSAQVRLARPQVRSPGPERSPTDISLNQLSLTESGEGDASGDDPCEGTSGSTGAASVLPEVISNVDTEADPAGLGVSTDAPPPGYSSPTSENESSNRTSQDQPDANDDDDSDGGSTPRPASVARLIRDSNAPGSGTSESSRLVRSSGGVAASPPLPSYDAAMGNPDSTPAGNRSQ